MTAKQNFSKYFFLPFMGLMVSYFLIFSYLNVHFWGHAPLEIDTVLKYTVSVVANKTDTDLPFVFEPPEEYRGYFTAILHQLYGQDLEAHWQPKLFYNFFLPEVFPRGYAYTFFPYFLIISLGFSVWVLAHFSGRENHEKKFKKDKYIRGTQKVTAQDFCRKSHKINDPGITIRTNNGGNLLLSAAKEKEHFLILGSTGTGKSTLLIAMVSQFIGRSQRLIFVDRKGEFYSRFGTSQDILFNPFDARSVHWNIFNEINFEANEAGELAKIPPDLQVIADLLFGVNDPQKTKNKYWYTSGAAVFCSAVCHLALVGTTTTSALTEFLTSPPAKIIKAFLALPKSLQVGLGALGLKPDAELVGSIMSVVTECAHQLACFVDADGPWSVREWVNSNAPGNLYISTAGKNDTSFNSIVTLLLDLCGREIKEFPDASGQETRLTCIIDELGALPPLATLTFLLTQSRSKGISVIIANQTFEKLRSVYGDHEARNIVACAKTRFFFQLPEATDARYISETLGRAEVERTTKNRNESSGSFLSAGQNRLGETISHSITLDDAFLPADIASLQTGQAIAVLPNLLPFIALLQLARLDVPVCNAEFEPVKTREISARALSAVMSLGQVPMPDKPEQQELDTVQKLDESKSRTI
jgi:type IV secretory pathway TraG/TraD family ATPase VirD4